MSVALGSAETGKLFFTLTLKNNVMTMALFFKAAVNLN